MLKVKHLDKGVRVAIVVVSKLMNEVEESSMDLTSMIYDLSEEGPDGIVTAALADIVEGPIDVASEDTVIVDSTIESANDALAINAPENEAPQIELMDRIRQVYLNDVILQRIMEAKREDLKRIPMNIIKEGVRLELEDCEIREDLFWIKDKLYVSSNESLHAALIIHIHESPFGDHAGRAVTYDRVSTHYYWPRMTNTIAQYVKACHSCKRIKAYREGKHGLLKSLPIPKRYWQDISVDFITPLLACVRNGRRFRHVMVVVDKLFKKRKFILMDSLEVDAIVQGFVEWI